MLQYYLILPIIWLEEAEIILVRYATDTCCSESTNTFLLNVNCTKQYILLPFIDTSGYLSGPFINMKDTATSKYSNKILVFLSKVCNYINKKSGLFL